MAAKKVKSSDKASKKPIGSSTDYSIKVKGYYHIILFLLFILIDRLTKIWATNLKGTIDYGIFAFTYTSNTGAGFSILQNSNALLAWIAVIILGLLIYYKEHLPRIGFILIISGLIGNLLDRIAYGYVIDFINFKFWPVFNAADSYIVIGAILTLIHFLKEEKKEKLKKRKTKIR